DVRPAREKGGAEPVRGGGKRRQLPIAKMRGEDEGRFSVVPQADKTLEAFVRELDALCRRARGIIVPQPVEMRELGPGPPQILPYSAQNGFDLGGRFLRKGRGEIGTPETVLGKKRAEGAHAAAREI